MTTAKLKHFWYGTAIIMAAAALVVVCSRIHAPSSTGKLFVSFPDKIGMWDKTRDIQYGDDLYRELGTRDVLGREYRDSAGRLLDVVVVHAVNNRSAFHPPEYCLTGGGSEIIERKDSMFSSAGRNFKVNEMLFIRNSVDTPRLLVWNWYAAGKDMDGDFFGQQKKLFINQLCSGRSPGAAINIYVPATPDTADEARAAAEDFASYFVPALEPYLE